MHSAAEVVEKVVHLIRSASARLGKAPPKAAQMIQQRPNDNDDGDDDDDLGDMPRL